MEERQIGYLLRLRKFAAHYSSRNPEQDSNLNEEEFLAKWKSHLRNEKIAPDALQLATDITNYAMMRMSFIDCRMPLLRAGEDVYFHSVIAAALMYRNAIGRYLRLHAPMRVDEQLFENILEDMTLNVVLKLRRSQRYVVACGAIVTAAHFYLQRGIPKYVALCRRFLAKFMTSYFISWNVEEDPFTNVDIGLVRIALAPYGAGSLATYYEDD